MKNLSLKQLKELGKEFKIKGYYKMNKAELLETIENLPMSYIGQIRDEQEAAAAAEVQPMTDEEAAEIEAVLSDEERFEAACRIEEEKAAAFQDKWVIAELPNMTIQGIVRYTEGSNCYVVTIYNAHHKFHYSELKRDNSGAIWNNPVKEKNRSKENNIAAAIELIEGRGDIIERPFDFEKMHQWNIDMLILETLAIQYGYDEPVIEHIEPHEMLLYSETGGEYGEPMMVELRYDEKKNVINIYDRYLTDKHAAFVAALPVEIDTFMEVI